MITLTTLYSGVEYFVKNRDIIASAWEQQNRGPRNTPWSSVYRLPQLAALPPDYGCSDSQMRKLSARSS